MGQTKKSYYFMEFAFPANIVELYTNDGVCVTSYVIEELMKEHVALTDSMYTKTAMEFVFDDKKSYEINAQGHGGIYIEFMNDRHKNQYKQAMSEFITWVASEMNVMLVDEVDYDIVYRHLPWRTSFIQVEPNGDVIELRGTMAEGAAMEISNNVPRRKGLL
jgi:hypothetical protein